MLTMIGQKFSELVKIGEAIEDGLKTGKIVSKVTQANTTGFVRKKKEDVSSISYSPASRSRGNFGSSSTIKNPNRLSPLNNHPQAPYSPYPIFYAQPNFQPPPQIYPISGTTTKRQHLFTKTLKIIIEPPPHYLKIPNKIIQTLITAMLKA
ncbi:hypothetical protein HAX54_035303 [Datura stramonium]|uniref:Uncharacterized protein n=1 Tax=Datura stramonium TaxID=4076 RepID=A0ABS8RMD6_DATST|nr:hypothetical protein [Datura stramonium]